MSETTHDVDLSVVPSLLPSCSPSLSSQDHDTHVPDDRDPIIDLTTSVVTENNACIDDQHLSDQKYDDFVSSDQPVSDFEEFNGDSYAHYSSNIDIKCEDLLNIEKTDKKFDTQSKTNCALNRDVVSNAIGEHDENLHIDDSTVDDIHAVNDCLGYSVHIPESDSNVNTKVQSESSNSTDGTLRNSDESCESDFHPVNSETFSPKSEVHIPNITMGNKQAGGKATRDDPEGKTKCCELPKRKAKDRNSRSSRSSRHDDLGFDAAEVYPFDGRSISEHELREPVELEPFEIVETDDIKFVPGAGTSDVIKSVSEPKFSTIPEETLHAMEFASATEEPVETCAKVPFYIEKGSKVEPGTSTAHSTFEFKQVKQKSKLVKITPDPFDHNYENVQLSSGNVAGVSGIERKASNDSSKSDSTPSSKNLSRNNSKDAKQKPARKGKAKSSESSASPTSASSKTETSSKAANDVKRKQTKSKKEPSIRDSEIDRKIDSVLMLTQTMFSQTKPSDKSEEQTNDPQQNAPAIKYENVGVVAKMDSAGIKIVHKEVPIKLSKESCENRNRNVTQCTDGKHCESPNQPSVARENIKKTYPQLSSDIMEISESGTLIIKSLADMPSEKPEMDEIEPVGSLSYDQSDEESFDQTDCKTTYATIESQEDDGVDQVMHDIKTKEGNDTGRNLHSEITNKPEEGCKSEVSKLSLEDVPPPSPLAMDALAEINEEEEDEEEDDNYDDDKRKSAEIVQFTENVCKRLSQLLILEGHKEEEENDNRYNEINDNTSSDDTKFADHIYETIDSNYRIVDDTKVNNKTGNSSKNDNLTLDDSVKLLKRSESTGTLKRISGDSETQQCCGSQDAISSESDDDMPSYFDPSQDSFKDKYTDLSSSDLNSCANTTIRIEELSGQNVSKDKSNTFKGCSYDNVMLESEDNVFSEPLKTFDLDLIGDTPSSNRTEELLDTTPTADAHPNFTPLTELANVEVETPLQYDTSGRHSVTYTESDLDISEHRDDLSTDSMLADDEAEETMEILFTKTYTEPVEGAEVFLSCTVVNSAYKEEQKKSETWLSDEALEYFEANASEVMSTAFLKAKKEMKDIQICLQSLRQQMEHFHSDHDDISLPDLPVESLSPDYFGIPHRKAITD